MAVEIRIPTLLRRHVNNQASISATGSTLGDVIANVRQTYPALTEQLVTGDGELHRFLNVYVNDDDVRYTGALATPIKDGDSITVLPAVAGG